MLTHLTELLLDKGLVATAEEIADILWLAGYLDPPSAQGATDKPADQRTTEQKGQERPDQQNETTSAASVRRATRTAQHTRRAEIYATQATAESDAERQAARPVRLPAAPALPGALEISRSLRPFMRRIPSRTRFLLDEASTAQRIADTDDWTPVLRPEPTRWLDVALVVDESSSMSMWRRTIAEVYHLLARQGAFRQITLWGVATSPDGLRMHLHTGVGIVPERMRSRDPRELLDHDNHRLIVVLSDCVAPAWHNNSWPALLAVWGRQGLVALTQMLPSPLWPRTGLRHFPAVLLQSKRAGAPNQALLATWPLPLWDQPEPTGIAIPVTTLEPAGLAAWARMIAGDNRIRLHGFMLPADLEPPKLDKIATAAPPTVAGTPPPTDQLLTTFHTTASPLARRLAGCLAALSSLSLPLIHLVQRVIVREARQADLAEVMLSGLIRRVTPRDRFDIPADQIEYRFLNEEVRTQLRSTVRISEGDAVRELVEKLSDYLEQHLGQLNDFAAYIADRSGRYQIARGNQVMARVRLASLQQAITPPVTVNVEEGVQVTDTGQGSYGGRANANLYALLVGINQYSSFSPALQGCVNDVQAMAGMLQAKFGIPTENIVKLLDEQATHQAIQAAWQRMIEQAKAWADGGRRGAPPTFLFHFSGYGQENLLFAHDSNPQRDQFIEKQHFEAWLQALNQYGAHPILILDTCSTAKYIARENDAAGWGFPQPAVVWVAAPKDEDAYEYKVGNSTFGAFTYSLVAELEQLDPDEAANVTYADLHTRVVQRLQALFPNQAPRLLGESNRLLFGGILPLHARFFRFVHVGEQIRLDGGLLHGLKKGARLSFYPATRTEDDVGPSLGTLRIVECRALESECRQVPSLKQSATVPPRGVALVEQQEFRRPVFLAIGDATLHSTLLSHLAPPSRYGDEEAITNFVQVVDHADAADFIIQSTADQLELHDRNGRRLVDPYPLHQINQLTSDLVHLVRYYNVLELNNDAPDEALTVTLAVKRLDFDPTTQAPVALDLPQRSSGEIIVEVGQPVVFAITNHSRLRLYVALLVLDAAWSISLLYPSAGGGYESLEPGRTVTLGLSAKRSEQLMTYLPAGLPEGRDIFKVIAGAAPADFTILEQGPLDSASGARKTGLRSVRRDAPSGLDHLLAQIVGDDPLLRSASVEHDPQVTTDWTTAELAVLTVTADHQEQELIRPMLPESFFKSYQRYMNFDLLVMRGSDGYQVRVIDSPAGQARVVVLIALDQVRQAYEAIWQSPAADLATIKNMGGQLFDALFQDEVLVCLRRSMDETERRGRGLRIRLRFADAPELHSLPWEYLYDHRSDRFFALSNATLFVRYLELSHPVAPLAVQFPLKVLVVMASPQDLPRLSLELESQRLQNALQELLQRGLVALTLLATATVDELQRALRQDDYHIFHFAGHGDFNPQQGEGFLLFETSDGLAQPVSGSQLGQLLHNHSSLRLATLNTDYTARAAVDRPMLSVAQQLCQQGLWATVGLQNVITDDAAIMLTNTLYSSLATGAPLDIALANARRALYLAGDTVAWGTPVLLSRSPDNHLFDLPPAPSVVQSTTSVAGSEAQPVMTFDWVTIPAGEFLMGSNPSVDHYAQSYEQPQHRLYLPEYRITRTPVTVAQFEQFVRTTGYQTIAEREGYAWGWTGSRWDQLPGVYWAQAHGPQTTTVEDRSQHPVTCILQEDALAFCAWARVRLPNEAEWEKAARGTDGRIYPWGNEPPTRSHANFNMHHRNTTTVGAFPRGASPYGLLDMAGNVWELTQTLWGEDAQRPAFAYPYVPTDGREDTAASLQILSMVRGGSFDNTGELLRCACREPGGGSERNDLSRGFRVVALDAAPSNAAAEQPQ